MTVCFWVAACANAFPPASIVQTRQQKRIAVRNMNASKGCLLNEKGSQRSLQSDSSRFCDSQWREDPRQTGNPATSLCCGRLGRECVSVALVKSRKTAGSI